MAGNPGKQLLGVFWGPLQARRPRPRRRGSARCTASPHGRWAGKVRAQACHQKYPRVQTAHIYIYIHINIEREVCPGTFGGLGAN